jgi:predicted O-methyltransferase YrrM
MNDTQQIAPPSVLAAIITDTDALGFPMASDTQTGSLLRTLAATKPGGTFLELGTGTGLATTWILDGMDRTARLTTLDNEPRVLAVAKHHLGNDQRVTFLQTDGGVFLETRQAQIYDFIFADTWPGKYDHLDEAFRLLKPGGLYVIDDMLPQPSWPDGHAARVPALLSVLEKREDIVATKLAWATGLVVATKRSQLARASG